ncbi:MAG TPA: ABC transporter permease [bacterium]|nr:ABC transporter permease [bacterium]
MKISDLFQETYFAILANKVRSSLTILGIVIGIGSVIAMVSIGQGSAQSITDRVESLGSNLLTVMPGSQRGQMVRGGMGSATTLSLEDAEAIKTISGVKTVAPVVSARKQVTVKGSNTNTSIYGVDENYFSVKSITLELGSAFSPVQIKAKNRVAVIGPTTRDTLYGESYDPVGQKIRIDSQEYTVIGVTESKGGTGMGSSDDLVYIPLGTAQQYLTGNSKLSNISVEVISAELMDFTEEAITSLLLQRHNISGADNADFSIMNQADMLSAMTDMTSTLTLLLGSIAGISLIVGGIGIMNMMLTTVTERTREIGLRKAIGAKRGDISQQFLAEAVTLTFISGIIGILLGWLLSYLVARFGSITTSISLQSVTLAFGVSGAIGIIFGYYPARRAAKLNPIEALRYE